MNTEKLRGFVDGCDSKRIWGWAINEENPKIPARIEIVVNGKSLRSLPADMFAPDLHVQNIGTGHHRWECEFLSTDDIRDGVNEVQVRFEGTTKELSKSPVTFMRSDLKFLKDIDPKAVLASMYLQGTGIEIGALHHPLRVPEGVTVKYVDRMSVEDLLIHYSEMRQFKLVPVDIIDDGEKLSKIEPNSQDFVIANHFLEHCEDPIETIINMTRVLKTSGVLFITIPNKRATLDVDRECTTMSHLIRDHEEGTSWSRMDHYREWTKVLFKDESPQSQELKAKELEAQNYSIHYHVFNEFGIFELLALMANRYNLPLNVFQVVNNNNHETIFVARKVDV